MERENREVFYILCTDVHFTVVHFEELARGSKSSVNIEVEDIWQLLALTRPHAYAIAHCHPSGKARPSRADRAMTKEIRRGSKRLFPNTVLLDHIIVGQREYYSFLDNNWE
jgi:DNA repair protein RadC